MGNNNKELKYVKWNTIIALLAIISSIIISIYTIKSQNDYWKDQYLLQLRQNANEIKLQKITDLSKTANQYFIFYKNYSLVTAHSRLVFGANLRDVLLRQAHWPDNNTERDAYRIYLAKKVIDLGAELIFQLLNLKPFFSEEAINEAKDISNGVNKFEYIIPDVNTATIVEFENNMLKKDTDCNKYFNLTGDLKVKASDPNLQPNIQLLIDSMYKEVLCNEDIVKKKN